MDGVSGISGFGGRQQLTPVELAQVAKLAARDREVRAHEAAHLAAAADLAAGGMKLIYEMGPDGQMYAVGGEVRIAVPGGGTPEETLVKARQLRAAAMAPDSPSSHDATAAAQAGQMEAWALQELAQRRSASGQSRPGFPGLNGTA